MERPSVRAPQEAQPKLPSIQSAIINAEKVISGEINFGEPEYISLRNAIEQEELSLHEREHAERLLRQVGPAQIANCLNHLRGAAQGGNQSNALDWLQRTKATVEFYKDHDEFNREIYAATMPAALLALAG